jgi:hypothetical protein
MHVLGRPIAHPDLGVIGKLALEEYLDLVGIRIQPGVLVIHRDELPHPAQPTDRDLGACFLLHLAQEAGQQRVCDSLLASGQDVPGTAIVDVAKTTSQSSFTSGA